MGPVLIALAVFAAIIIIFALWAISVYNRMVQLKVSVPAGWAQIDVVLKRRHDLIPNLVETVKGYATHEKETLERVIAARNQAASAQGPQQASAAEGALSGALRQLFALSEAYPDLKANTNFLQLQGELASTENQIGSMRNAYNSSVQAYNTYIMMVPNNLIAGPFGFTPAQFFEIQDPVQREAPTVKF